MAKMVEILYECLGAYCSSKGHIFIEKIPQDQKVYEIKTYYCPWCNSQMSTQHIKESDYNIRENA